MLVLLSSCVNALSWSSDGSTLVSSGDDTRLSWLTRVYYQTQANPVISGYVYGKTLDYSMNAKLESILGGSDVAPQTMMSFSSL